MNVSDQTRRIRLRDAVVGDAIKTSSPHGYYLIVKSSQGYSLLALSTATTIMDFGYLPQLLDEVGKNFIVEEVYRSADLELVIKYDQTL